MRIDGWIQGSMERLEMEGSCHYHKAPDFLHRGGIVPQGASPSLMYFLYPYLLALSYGGGMPGLQRCRHPEALEGVTVQIMKKKPRLRERSLNVVKIFLMPIKPIGRIRCQPEVEAGNRSVPFDLGTEGTLCPAALRSILPFWVREELRASKGDGDPHWRVSCPDHLKNLVFGYGEPDGDFYDSICSWGAGTQLIEKRPCSLGRNARAESLDEISTLLDFPCPSLLNVSYGYYLTLCTGGELGFSAPSLKAAIYQCPNPLSRVIVRIWKRSEWIDFEVLHVMGQSCPRAIKEGDRFHLPSDPRQNRFCLDAFNVLFPYAGLSEFLEGSVIRRCVVEDCDASYELRAGDG